MLSLLNRKILLYWMTYFLKTITMIKINSDQLKHIVVNEIKIADYSPILKNVFEAIFPDSECTVLEDGTFNIEGSDDVIQIIKDNC
jgi:hypothetical protein